jgi:hypothetical protein
VCVCVCVCVCVRAAFHPKLSQDVPKYRNIPYSPLSPLKLFPISLFLRHAQLHSNTIFNLCILLQWKLRNCLTSIITYSNVFITSVYLIAKTNQEVRNCSAIKPGTVKAKQGFQFPTKMTGYRRRELEGSLVETAQTGGEELH